MKYYFITYIKNVHMGSSIGTQNAFIDIHPLEFKKKNSYGFMSSVRFGDEIILLNWKEITEEEYNKYK